MAIPAQCVAMIRSHSSPLQGHIPCMNSLYTCHATRRSRSARQSAWLRWSHQDHGSGRMFRGRCHLHDKRLLHTAITKTRRNLANRIVAAHHRHHETQTRDDFYQPYFYSPLSQYLLQNCCRQEIAVAICGYSSRITRRESPPSLMRLDNSCQGLSDICQVPNIRFERHIHATQGRTLVDDRPHLCARAEVIRVFRRQEWVD